MTLEQTVAKIFMLDEKAFRRHSNPWSVYTRFSMIPLLGLAFWSRVWIGWWSLVPIAIVLLWVWLNPRVFPEPKSTNNWASKIVLGEWVWMNRKNVPVPKHHCYLPNVLNVAGAIGGLAFIGGLALLHVWLTILGGVVMFISKLWFADRMVWLYEDMNPPEGNNGTKLEREESWMVPQSKAACVERRTFQFSLRSLLLMTLIIALAVASLLMYRRLSDAEGELVTLRNEAGYLKIEDETLFHAIAVPCEEPLTWKWRAYLPKGREYSWHLNSGMIPAMGVLDGGASSQETLPRSQGMEVTITVAIRKDPEPKNRRWLFNLTYRSADGREKQSTGTSIPDQTMEQFLQAHMTDGECFAELKAETRKRGESIILLKRRIGEQTSATSWSTSSKPQPGFVVWLEEGK